MNTQATSSEPVTAPAVAAGPAPVSRNQAGAAFQDVLSQLQQPVAQPSPTDGPADATVPPQNTVLLPNAGGTMAGLQDAKLSPQPIDSGALAAPTKAKTQKDTSSKLATLDPAPALLAVPGAAVPPAPQTMLPAIAPVTTAAIGSPMVGQTARDTPRDSSDAAPVGVPAGTRQATAASLAKPDEASPGPGAATSGASASQAADTQAANIRPASALDAKAAKFQVPDSNGPAAAAAEAVAPLNTAHHVAAPNAVATLDASLATAVMPALDVSALASAQAGVAASAAATLPAAPASPTQAALASPAALTSPAAQLSPALVQIANTAGSNHITIRLDPGELGSVAVRIDRSSVGAASVQVTVERPETLRLLQNDQPALQRALDAAGLPQEGRTVTLSLATPDQTGAPAASTPSFTSAGGAGSGNLGSGSSGGGAANGSGGGYGGSSSGGSGGQPHGRQDSRYGQVPAQTTNSSPGWLRAGIDITA